MLCEIIELVCIIVSCAMSKNAIIVVKHTHYISLRVTSCDMGGLNPGDSAITRLRRPSANQAANDLIDLHYDELIRTLCSHIGQHDNTASRTPSSF